MSKLDDLVARCEAATEQLGQGASWVATRDAAKDLPALAADFRVVAEALRTDDGVWHTNNAEMVAALAVVDRWLGEGDG